MPPRTKRQKHCIEIARKRSQAVEDEHKHPEREEQHRT